MGNVGKQYFTNVEVIGDTIIDRYIDEDGVEKVRKTVYEPTLFLKTPAKTKYKDIYDNYCVPKKFPNIREARKWLYQKKRDGEEVLGMDNFILAYLSDVYDYDIEYDINKIRIAIFDIEVTTDGEFPNEYEAKYPIDAISIYDTLDDKVYMFDLIKDDKLGVKEVKPWTPELDILSEDIVNKVVYKTYTCSDKLLLDFVDYIRTKLPSILIGWNSDRFDIPYIYNRLKNRFGSEVAKSLSPYNDIYERTSYDSYENKFTSYNPKGVACMDYMEIYKAFRFKTQPSYSLDYIGKEETGIGKIEYDVPIHTLRRGNYIPSVKPPLHDEDGNELKDTLGKWLYAKFMVSELYDRRVSIPKLHSKLKEILNRNNAIEEVDSINKILDFIDENGSKIDGADVSVLAEIKDEIFEIYSGESHRRYITYSIFDVVLVKNIDESLSFMELVFDIAYYAKMPLDSVMSKIQIWDSIIFNSLKRENRVVPMKDIPEHNERIVGAFVKDPIVGVHKYVLSFDLTSLKYMGL